MVVGTRPRYARIAELMGLTEEEFWTQQRVIYAGGNQNAPWLQTLAEKEWLARYAAASNQDSIEQESGDVAGAILRSQRAAKGLPVEPDTRIPGGEKVKTGDSAAGIVYNGVNKNLDWGAWPGPDRGVATPVVSLISVSNPPVYPAGSQSASIWSAILALVGGLLKVPTWVWTALSSGVSLMVIWDRLKSGSGDTAVTTPGTGGNGGTKDGSAWLQGPGVPEPRVGTYYNSWRTVFERKDGKTGYTWFWAMNDGYIISYTTPGGRSKRWKPKKPIGVIMSGGKTSIDSFIRIDKMIDRVAKRIAKRSPRLKLQTKGR